MTRYNRYMSLLDPFLLPNRNVSLATKLNRFFYKNQKQASAGCIVYFIEDSIPLFLQFFVSDDGKTGEWCFPKGIVEKTDKNIEERALKETKEEVGLDVKIITKLKSNNYKFYWDKDRIKFDKIVNYFLAEADTKNVELAKYSPEQDEKDTFKEFSWSSLDKSLSKTKHQNEKDILNEAFTYLKTHNIN